MVLQHIEQSKDREGEGSCLRPRVRGWSKDAEQSLQQRKQVERNGPAWLWERRGKVQDREGVSG